MASSDAFMEISDPDVWGESYDAQFKKRGLGAFEISKFSFDVSDTVATKSTTTPGAQQKPGAQPPPAAKSADKHKQPDISKVTITKFIDKASPDLFLACLKKTPMKWAVISIRESGETGGMPWLIIEFQDVTIVGFKWDMTPGEEKEGAAAQETIEFDFKTILIKYSRQGREGQHHPIKMKGWRRAEHDEEVGDTNVSQLDWSHLRPDEQHAADAWQD
jgi:type VI secretion system Hcp family effector